MITFGTFCTFHFNFNEFSAASARQMILTCSKWLTGKSNGIVWTKTFMIDAFYDAGGRSEAPNISKLLADIFISFALHSSKQKFNHSFVVGCR